MLGLGGWGLWMGKVPAGGIKQFLLTIPYVKGYKF